VKFIAQCDRPPGLTHASCCRRLLCFTLRGPAFFTTQGYTASIPGPSPFGHSFWRVHGNVSLKGNVPVLQTPALWSPKLFAATACQSLKRTLLPTPSCAGPKGYLDSGHFILPCPTPTSHDPLPRLMNCPPPLPPNPPGFMGTPFFAHPFRAHCISGNFDLPSTNIVSGVAFFEHLRSSSPFTRITGKRDPGGG